MKKIKENTIKNISATKPTKRQEYEGRKMKENDVQVGGRQVN